LQLWQWLLGVEKVLGDSLCCTHRHIINVHIINWHGHCAQAWTYGALHKQLIHTCCSFFIATTVWVKKAVGAESLPAAPIEVPLHMCVWGRVLIAPLTPLDLSVGAET